MKPGTSLSDALVLYSLLFVGLKLAGIISWSWAAVLAPLWLPPVIALAVSLVAAICIGIGEVKR